MNNKHILIYTASIKVALTKLDILAVDAILFIVDSNNKLIGTLTDGDVRRGLIKGVKISDPVTSIIQSKYKFIQKDNYDLNSIIKLRENNYKIFPVIDSDSVIVDIVNFRLLKSYLPIDAVIMAGGRGSRLKPLTNTTPKPLLPVGDKTIMEHNIDRLIEYGLQNFWFSINYLGDQIQDFFGSGEEKNTNINYVREKKNMGTIGAVSKIDNFIHDDILITNSDILTNLNYEKFYLNFKNSNADISIVSIPYEVNIPYAVLEKNSQDFITGLKEKPVYTYYSNGGIYLMKKSVLDLIPENSFYNATDLIEKAISLNKKVISFSFNGYWLDVGKHEDYEKAQKDVYNIIL